ncbi:MAG: hypothetical protein ACYC06_09330, partial [Ilumatobacteraceae bacterium]
MNSATPPSTPIRKKIDKQSLLISFGIALGLVLIALGMRTGLTGRDATNLPDAIENISPGDGDKILRQAQVIVDFAEGYTAVLTIDGFQLPTTRLDELTANGVTPKPGAQVELPPTAIFDPGNYIISYQPQAGAPIEEFTQGDHTASVRYWNIQDGEQSARI